MSKPRFVAIGPDGDVVYDSWGNTFFPSKEKAMRAVQDELDEPTCECDGHTMTLGDEMGWTAKDYRIFKEVADEA